ncbi:MAG: Bro-N domain-containing protein [Candidatus Competibacteraceae bacterium]|nr:Bro-N domain-containing protein [Candidatus Competibacteraceae bacterium]
MSSIVTFNFVAQRVRIVMRGNEPWFVAADVCEALTIANSRMALDRLDDDEKGVSSIDTPGGNQELSIINESGLYSLILTSRKPEAKKFKKWVTSEVLPAIRKTGRYEHSTPRPALSAGQWQTLDSLIHFISLCCHFKSRASHAAHERIRFGYGLRQSRDLLPEHFEAVKADLEGLRELAEQHQSRMVALDEEFITAVIRPPVSVRKVRAMAKKQSPQPPLDF